MKKILLIILCLLGTSAFADTSAVEQLIYDGYNQTEELNLSTEKTRTEYRTVRVPSICYRTEYRRQCQRAQPTCRRICDRNGNCRRVCSGAQRICRNVPVQVSYRCIRNERRAFQVHDYYVETQVQFQFNTNQTSDMVQEKFTMRVTGDRANLSVNGSKNYFLVLDNQSRTESRSGGTKFVNLVYKVSLVPTNTAKSVLANGIQGVKYRNGILNFEVGPGFNLSQFSQQIRIFRNRRIGTDPLLLNKILTQNDMNVQTNMNASMMTIDLRNLGITLPSRMRVILDTKFKIDENKVLNKGEIKTSAYTNWVFR